MRKLNGLALLSVILGVSICSVAQSYQGTEKDRRETQQSGDAIRAAFARGDVDGIMAYHHLNVIKALTPGPYIIGSAAVKAGLVDTLEAFSLTFTTSHVDNTFFQGDTAIQTSTFTITGTPKHGGNPFVSRGRAMVVYVRSSKSPSGRDSIREIIQPAT